MFAAVAMPCTPVPEPWFMSSSIKVSRTSSSRSKTISIRISIRVRLRSVEIIEPEMSPYFWPWTWSKVRTIKWWRQEWLSLHRFINNSPPPLTHRYCYHISCCYLSISSTTSLAILGVGALYVATCLALMLLASKWLAETRPLASRPRPSTTDTNPSTSSSRV